MTKNTTQNYSLTIGWLYPDLMSTYGDRGNILVLQKRCLWRGISVEILPITEKTTDQELEKIDLLFGGGAQDVEQSIVMKDLRKKGELIKNLIEHNIPSLFVCGSPQLMGLSYEPSVGEKIEGLGIFDMVSKHPGINAKRLIGNTVGKIYWENLLHSKELRAKSSEQNSTPDARRPMPYIVGFENHGGRSYLGSGAKPFAKVVKGHGNNGEDGEEGVVYKNAIGCYYHGPLLPKNPHLADWLIRTALEVKYEEIIELPQLDDTLEYLAQTTIAKKLRVRL
jgi:CobQ-like glutamine amidotransferase family enzyme